MVRRGELEVVAFFRIGYAPAREEGPAQEGHAVALLLDHAEVDVVGERRARLRAEGLEDLFDLVPVADDKAALARCALVRQHVEGDGKGAAEQPRQARGEGVGGRDDADLPGREGVAVEQHAVALGDGAALFIYFRAAELRFGVG